MIPCTTCGKFHAYASVGGNLVPYIPAKFPADAEQKCYAVVFMNYHPLKVDSLWKTREGAKTHIQGLTNPSNWDICEMEIRGS